MQCFSVTDFSSFGQFTVPPTLNSGVISVHLQFSSTTQLIQASNFLELPSVQFNHHVSDVPELKKYLLSAILKALVDEFSLLVKVCSHK